MKQITARHEEPPWTAARCNRLLRTITSRLGILRKLAKHVPQAQITEQGRCTSKDSTASCGADSVQIPAAPTTSSPRANDPDWIPRERKRRCDRTYGGNSKRRKVKADEREAQVVHELRTPFIKRILSSNLALSPSESPTTLDLTRLSQADPDGRKRRALPILPSSSADQAYRALLEALEALLTATRPDGIPSRLGTSSLLETCLRKIPAFIDLEKSEAESGPESENTISDTYEYLETFGSRSGSGWKGLRCIVRAHAIYLIQGALNDNILPGDALEALLTICKRREAIAESQLILSAWLEHRETITREIIEKFIALCRRYGHRSLLLRCCGDLIHRNPTVLPHLSDNSTLWHEVVKAFISPSTCASAASLCETFMTGWIQHEWTAEERIELPRIKALCESIVLLTACAWSHHGTGSSMNIANHLCRWPGIAKLARMPLDQIRVGLPFLASSLTLEVTGRRPSADLRRLSEEDTLSFLGENSASEPEVAMAIDFIFETAMKISQVDRISADNFMRSAATGLLRLGKTSSNDIGARFNGIATAVAKCWADHCDDDESYNLLEEIEYAVWDSERHDSSTDALTPQRPTSYRWEEGLCEWVAKTPNVKEAATAISSGSDCTSDSLHDSGVDLENESPAEKGSTCSDYTKLSEGLDKDELDDEDKLALIMPIQQRQKRARVRFEVMPQDHFYRQLTHKAPKRSQAPVLLDDASDDELSF